MTLPIGTTLLNGTYRIVRYIASGGFGNTYEAEQVRLGKHVAIKEFFVKDFNNRDEETNYVTVGTQSKVALVEKLKRKFIDEAHAIAALSHPNIVRVSDVFEENGTAYYVMDYIDGQSLGDIIKKDGALPETRAIGYIRQIANALEYIHSQNRLHLDIKPANVMIDTKDDAILIDFGASKQYDEENGENTSTMLGYTTGYAPLEQMAKSVTKFTPSTDIYALGATLYKMVAGNTAPDANIRVADGETLAFPSHVSSDIQNAITHAMQLARAKRPQTVAEWLKLLPGKVSVAVPIAVPTPSSGTDDGETVIDPGIANRGRNVVKTFNFESKRDYVTEEISKGRTVESLVNYLCSLGADKAGAESFVTAIEKVTPVSEDDSEEGFKAKVKDWLTDFKSIAIVFACLFIAGGYRYLGSCSSSNQNNQVSAAVDSVTTDTIQHEENMLNGHRYVDLGLSVKWATCNLGGETPLDYGDLYQWGNAAGMLSRGALANLPSNIGGTEYDLATKLWGD